MTTHSCHVMSVMFCQPIDESYDTGKVRHNVPPPNASSTGNQPNFVFLNCRFAKYSGLGDHPDSLDTFVHRL